MPYTFKLPNYMRLFAPTGPKSALLYRTGETLAEGQTVQVALVEVKTYDHRDQLVLKLTDGRYLLVEEIDDDIRERSYQWTELYTESVVGKTEYARSVAKGALEKLQNELAPFMRKYIRPELQVVGDAPLAAFDKQGPGIHPVILF